MNTILWIAQILLAALYAWHGWLLLTWPTTLIERSRQQMPAALFGISPGLRRFIGAAEATAALGLVLPGLTGIMPWLTPLAAFGLIIVMISATAANLLYRQPRIAVFTTGLIVLAAFVAFTRWQVMPL